ncbi:hypothetical protein PIB30_051456 [Stylosanthes scabra]|uniref:Uncharacterized protein n=1 Tax=Stylosanthes scabra TaxID=79078 RepID=A0ABU6TK66_9FABA|nr:hypothetical protein [Stylosanthes scabra]
MVWYVMQENAGKVIENGKNTDTRRGKMSVLLRRYHRFVAGLLSFARVVRCLFIFIFSLIVSTSSMLHSASSWHHLYVPKSLRPLCLCRSSSSVLVIDTVMLAVVHIATNRHCSSRLCCN